MAAPPRIARGRAHLGEFEIVALFLTHCGKYSPPFMRKLIALPLIITFGLAAFVQAQPKSRADAETLIATLKFQQGQIVLRNGLATVNVPPGFRYLDGADAKKVLVDLWGNPPGAEPLGLLMPDVSLISRDAWAVIITYAEDGYVKDHDAERSITTTCSNKSSAPLALQIRSEPNRVIRRWNWSAGRRPLATIARRTSFTGRKNSSSGTRTRIL